MYLLGFSISLILLKKKNSAQDPFDFDALEKMDPDPGHFFKIYWTFLTNNNFQFFVLFSFAYFYPITWWTIQKWGNFYNLSFFKKSDLSLRVKKFFFVVIGWYFSTWIRIRGSAYFCGSGFRTRKSCDDRLLQYSAIGQV